MPRELEFWSEGVACAARLYEPDSGSSPWPCILMGHGFSLTIDDGLELYARHFTAAGLAVVAFDYRFLGHSGGEPRQRFRPREQQQDWLAAASFAAGLDAVDPARLIPWGYSFGGGHLVALLAAGRIAAPAAITLVPFVDGLRRALSLDPAGALRSIGPALLDAAGIARTIPATAEPGSVGAMTFPGEAAGFERAVPEGSAWRNEIGAGVLATVALHRPFKRAGRIAAPLWVGFGEADITSHPDSVRGLARRAQRGELHRYPLDHFEVLLPEHAGAIAADQLAFLGRLDLLG